MRIFKVIMIAVSLLCILSMVSACGAEKKWFRDRSNDYKEAESYPTIKIPVGVNADSCSSEYRVP